jgi:glutamate carboxypeptidase
MGRRAAQQLLAWLTAQEEQMIALLEELVVAESPSVDPRALERALAIVERELVELGFVVRRAAGAQGGSHLFARPRLRYRHSGRQLVIGHVDTVWPLGTLESMPLRRGDGDLFGPGVFDMKGGLVEVVYALRALSAAGLVPSVTPVVFVNVDEEVGSLDSRRHLLRLAQGAVRAFVLEGAAGREGALKTARKGGGHFTLSVHGRAAHAGSNPEEGVSAIVELAEQIRRLNELNDPARGVTVNVGTVDGGLRPNVVAALASAEIDVRAPTARDADRLERAVRGLESTLPGASLEIGGGFRRPPMEASPPNRALFRRAQELARLLGYGVEEAGVVGGSSDANLTSVWAPTLDGLGPVGGGAHAQDERIVVSSLPQRAALLALLLLEPAPSGTLSARRRSRTRSGARVLLVGSPSNETNGRLQSAWSRLGIEAELVSAPGAVRDLFRPGDVTLGRLDVLPTLDGVEPGLLELLVLESSGFTVLNGARTLLRCHDKWRTAQVLQAAGLPHPATVVVAGTRRPISLEPPVVVKPRFGSWGAAVERCDTRDEVEDCLARASATSWFRRHGALVQELVPSAGVDLRVVVAGGEVVGAIERVAQAGEWRTNTSLGAVRRPVDPPADARALAIAAAVAVGASLVGVDLLPLDAGGYTVVELNGAVDFNVEYGVGRDALVACAEALGLHGPGSKLSERAAHTGAG